MKTTQIMQHLIGKTYKEIVDHLRTEEDGGDCCGWSECSIEDSLVNLEDKEAAVLVDVVEIDYSDEYSDEYSDALRAKIEAMEKQDPVARFNWSKGKIEWLRPWNYSAMNMKPLYLAPGAKGECDVATD